MAIRSSIGGTWVWSTLLMSGGLPAATEAVSLVKVSPVESSVSSVTLPGNISGNRLS